MILRIRTHLREKQKVNNYQETKVMTSFKNIVVSEYISDKVDNYIMKDGYIFIKYQEQNRDLLEEEIKTFAREICQKDKEEIDEINNQIAELLALKKVKMTELRENFNEKFKDKYREIQLRTPELFL